LPGGSRGLGDVYKRQVVRYKNNHYLFNPIAVLPAKENYMSVCAQWFEITGQDVNVSAFIPIGS
jgi:hypothetical protein